MPHSPSVACLQCCFMVYCGTLVQGVATSAHAYCCQVPRRFFLLYLFSYSLIIPGPSNIIIIAWTGHKSVLQYCIHVMALRGVIEYFTMLVKSYASPRIWYIANNVVYSVGHHFFCLHIIPCLCAISHSLL